MGAVVLGARIEATDWDSRIAHDGLQTVAGVSAALLVGGGIIRWWQEREWKRRTRAIALDLIDQAMRQTAVLASHALYVLGAPESIRVIDDLFKLPWTPRRDVMSKRMDVVLVPKVLALVKADGSAHGNDIVERAIAAAVEMERRADRLRELVLELGPYVPGDPISLVDHAVLLRRSAREVTGPLPGYRGVPGQLSASAAGVATSTMLTESIEFARRLGEEDRLLRAMAKQSAHTQLSAEIAEEEAQVEEDDRFDEGLDEFDRGFEESARQMEQSAQEIERQVQNLSGRIQAMLDDNPSPEQLRIWQEKLQSLCDRLSDALEKGRIRAMRDGPLEKLQRLRDRLDDALEEGPRIRAEGDEPSA